MSRTTRQAAPTRSPGLFVRPWWLAAVLLVGVNALAADSAGYPRWRGPEGSGAAADSGAELVDSFADARLLWVSQAENPLPYDYKGLSRPQRLIGNGGFGPPIISDGRIYVAYFTPSGPKAKIFWGNVDEDSPESVKHIAADGTLTCLDAETGLTLWTTRFERTGLNFAGKQYAGHYIPAIAEGHAVWVGSLGQMHCVDAKTGEKRWTTSTGWEADLDARYLTYCLDVKKIGGRGPNDRSFKTWKAEPDAPMKPCELAGSRGYGWDSVTVIADGVAVTNTRTGALVGVDIQSGKRRWRHDNTTQTTRAPLLWRHGGKAYIVGVSRSNITCVAPRTGKIVWQAKGAVTGRNYNGHTPAIQDDTLVATGPEGSWSGYRLTPSGARHLWDSHEVLKTTYESPLIYRGHLYAPNIKPGTLRRKWDELSRKWPRVFTKELRDDLSARNAGGNAKWRTAIAAVDMRNGEITGVAGSPMFDHASPVAMDGRLLGNANGVCIIDADPRAPNLLDEMRVQNIWCCTPSVADGKLYTRGARSLVLCWDLRRNAPAETTRQAGDWRNARMQLDFRGIRQPHQNRRMIRTRGGTAPIPAGEDFRLHLRTRDGRIEQAWITYGPNHVEPEQAFVDGLTLEDGRLSGTLRCHVLGLDYEADLSADLRNRQIAGTYSDPATGMEVNGPIGGEAKRIARKNGKVKFRLRREWNGGQNKSHETHLDFELKDGKGVSPKLYTRGKKTWTPTIHHFDARFTGSKLTGTLVVDTVSHDHTRSGKFRVEFATNVSCNRAQGRYRSWRNGEEVTPHSKVNQSAWGTIVPPEAEALDPANALYEIKLKDALPRERGLVIYAAYENGQPVSIRSRSPRFCHGHHDVDFDRVKLKGNRLSGPINVIVRTDGHVPMHDMLCQYDIDLRVQDDDTLQGQHNGVYGVRQPKQGKIEGRFVGR